MEKIWIKNYPPGVPESIDPNSFSSLTDYLHDSFNDYAHQPAFENLGTTLSYQKLQEKSLNMAAYLQQHLGLYKGDRLAIMLPNLLQYPITLLAALHLGLIIVNINPLYTERELLFPLVDSGAKAIVVLANFTRTLSQVIPKTKIEHIILTEVGDEFPHLKRVLINTYLKYIKKAVPSIALKVIPYREAMQEGENLVFEQSSIEPNDIAFLQYTGGTTGIPKGAVLTHKNLIANVMQCIAWIDHTLEKGKEIVVTALPLYHIFSLTICCFAFLKLGGKSLLITNPRDMNAFIKELKKTPFTVFVGVNTLYHALLKQDAFPTLDFKSMKLALAGGMSVIKSIAEQWHKLTGKTIIMGYGLTEASPVVTINPLNATEFTGSIGLPVPSTDVAILDDQEMPVPIHTPGEICLKGPQVMQGYWHQPQETKIVLSESGWLHTGDIAMMDEQGYIYLIDRKKDMILVSGFNVYPNEVEEVIASHPGVAEVAVIGIPNNLSGETVKAFIVKKDATLTKEEIEKHCKEKLTGYKLPKAIEFCTELPKSNVGKVLKQKLREANIDV